MPSSHQWPAHLCDATQHPESGTSSSLVPVSGYGLYKQEVKGVPEPQKPTRAVISYAHGPNDEQVVALADQLNRDGIDCEVDAYDQEPTEGWGRRMNAWMSDRVVLVVCSRDYYERFRLQAPPGVGLGVTFESGLLIQRVLESQGSNATVVPVVLQADDVSFIPEFLRDVTHYDLSKPDGYERLHRRLTARPVRTKPPLGPVRKFGKPAPSAVPLSTQPAPVKKFVLFFADGVGACAIGYVEIESIGKTIKMTLAPENGEESTFLKRLATSGKSFAVAFGSEAVWVRVSASRDVLRDRRLVELSLSDETPHGSLGSEMSYNGISTDDIATMRARRILLDEKLPDSGAGDWARQLNDQTLEVFVRGPIGNGRVLNVMESPLPALARTATAIDNEFLEIARLMAVLFLVLSAAVEHVVSLAIARVSDDELQVDFIGIRSRVYANQEPARIEVHGRCPLG